MALIRTKVYEDAEVIMWDERDPDRVPPYSEVISEYKPGSLEANRRDLVAKAQSALGTNATYLGRANPTAAQNTAQVQALTRQCNVLIRLYMDAFDTTAGT